jgi:hypothetical protein
MTKFFEDSKTKLTISSSAIALIKGGKAIAGFGGNKTTILLIDGTPFILDKTYEEIMSFLKNSDEYNTLEVVIKESK